MSITKTQATETLEIFAKAMGAYDPQTIDDWDDYGWVSIRFELDYLTVTSRAYRDKTPGSIYVSINDYSRIHLDETKKIVSVEGPASVCLAAANMAIANHQVAVASA